MLLRISNGSAVFHRNEIGSITLFQSSPSRKEELRSFAEESVNTLLYITVSEMRKLFVKSSSEFRDKSECLEDSMALNL